MIAPVFVAHMIAELDYGLGGHFKGRFVAKNSNTTPEWRQRVWMYGARAIVARLSPKNKYSLSVRSAIILRHMRLALITEEEEEQTKATKHQL